MRKFIIPIVAAASTLAMAAPASAQYVAPGGHWVPPVYTYNPYNYGNGFSYHAFANSMQQRVARIRSDIRMMQQRRVLSWREARGLDRQAEQPQRRIFFASRNGIQPGEARNLENQIFHLQRRVAREANDWNNRFGGRRRPY